MLLIHLSIRLGSAMSSFNDFALNPILLSGLERMDIHTPTPIQNATLEASLQGRDIIGLAPTGTGKTLAYTIPLAQRLLDDPPPRVKGRPVDPSRRIRSLVLCPVRELAQQVAEEGRSLFRGSVLRSKAVFGKSALKPQREALQSGVDLLVGTPGRLRELIDCGALSLAHVRQVVVDEADRMLDMGFLPQVRHLLERIPDQRQMLFFSATMPKPISALASDFLDVPYRAEIGANTAVGHIGQYSMHVPDSVKVPIVLSLIKDQELRGVVVFSRTRRRAGWVATALRRNGLSVGLVHGNRSQAQRQRAIERFSAGELPVLVATDVAARGLHISAIETVINYDLPVSTEEYVHRVGRAAHGGGVGNAFSLVSPREEDHWLRFRSVAGTKVGRIDPPPYEHWMREVDLERLQKTRDGEKALKSFERKAKLREEQDAAKGRRRTSNGSKGGKSKPSGKKYNPEEHRSSSKPDARQGGGKRNKKKSEANANPKFGARGQVTRRLGKQRPVSKNERPGGGVRKVK